jgi:hypothetical protein
MTKQLELQNRENAEVSWESFLQCYEKICISRERTPTPFDLEVAQCVYQACSNAVNDTKAEQRLLRTVAAPTGGGKTTAALAYAGAHVLSGGSVLFLGTTKQNCDEAYRVLELLLGTRVAIRTTDHDKQILDERGEAYIKETYYEGGYSPAAFFYRSTLRDYPALVATHEGYKKNAKELLSLSDNSRRTLIQIDELPEMIEISVLTLEDLTRLNNICKERLGLDNEGCEPQITKAMGDTCRQLSEMEATFDRSLEFHKFNLKHDFTSILAIKELRNNLGLRKKISGLNESIEKKLTPITNLILQSQEHIGYAFARVEPKYTYGAKFVTYQSGWPLEPGMVLFDATADIDGYGELSKARRIEKAPKANYSELKSYLLKGPRYLTETSPNKLLKDKVTREAMLRWMKRCVLENTREGERILLISRKDVIESSHLQKLSWHGREINYCHYGTGVGSNEWRDCTVVFIFGGYVKPKHITIAETLAILDEPFHNSQDIQIRELLGDYKIIKLGLARRWFKQLAMRGCARELDSNGVACSMRLYFTLEQSVNMIEAWAELFPNAPYPEIINLDEPEENIAIKKSRRTSTADDLIEYLLSVERTEVTSSEIQEATDIKLKEAWRRLENNESFIAALEQLGWTYVLPEKGRGNKLKFIRK